MAADSATTAADLRLVLVTDEKPECWRCHRVLAWEATRPWRIKCGRCNAENSSPPIG